MPIGSILKQAAKELPDKIKAQAIPNALKKGGVKDEELKYAGIKDPQSKEDLAKQIETRPDEFHTVISDRNVYQGTSLPDGKNNPTYREKVLTYSDTGAKPDSSRYTSDHFNEIPDYLMHTRIYNDNIGGKETRVIQELQSDLHQAGRQQGYEGANINAEEIQKFDDLRMLVMDDNTTEDTIVAAATELGWTRGAGGLNIFGDIEDFATTRLLDAGGGPEGVVNIPRSPFEKTWLRKGLEREISDALDEGLEQVAIPISGAVESLKRSQGVQKWYETVVASTAKKLAKSANMDFEIVKGGTAKLGFSAEQVAWLREMSTLYHKSPADKAHAVSEIQNLPAEVSGQVLAGFEKGETVERVVRVATFLDTGASDSVSYAVIKPKGGAAKPSFALYASPAATTMTAYLAFKSGMGQEDVETQLTEEGYSKPEIQDILTDVNKVAQMKAEGYTDEDIKPLLEKQEVQVGKSKAKATAPLEPKTPGRITRAQEILSGDEKLSLKDQVKHMQIVFPDLSYVHTNVAGLFGDQEAQRVSDEAVTASRQRIVNEFAERGVTVEYGTDPATGNQEWLSDGQVITPAWYEGFSTNQSEMLTGMAGAATGAAYGSSVTPPAVTPPTAILKVLAMGTGAIVGAALGAAAGTELDYLRSAMAIQEDMEASVAVRRAFNAAEMSVIGDAVGFGLFKLGKGSLVALKGAKKLISQGLNGRAVTALEETMFITKEESQQLVDNLARVSDLEGAAAKEKVEAVVLTKPGAESLVSAAVADDPRASQAVIKSIDDRAKDLLAATQELSGDNLGRFIREDLEGYRTLVREQFTRVKEAAGKAPRLNTFKFDYDKMAVDPVLESLGAELIKDSPEQMKFLHQAQKIRDLSASRRLPDLLELRKLVSDFQYNKRLKSAKSFKTLWQIKEGIDRSIKIGAEVTMDNPKEWLAQWGKANKDYSAMKVLETNKLAKAISERPAQDLTGANEDALAKAMVKYSTAIDSTFVDVMAKLPKKSRMRVEGLVIDELSKKFTTGSIAGMKATDFPALAFELQKVTLTSPEARSMRKAILELANVFKNDVPVSVAAGGVHTPRMANVMADNPVTKAKFALASESFHRAKSWMPTTKGRAAALVSKTAEVLASPLNSKSIKELQAMYDGQFNIAPELEELMKAAARDKAADTGTTRLKLYGDGKVLVGKGVGKEHSINPQNIASTEVIADVSEATGINIADKIAIDRALAERGYVAAQQGSDKVRLLEKK